MFMSVLVGICNCDNEFSCEYVLFENLLKLFFYFLKIIFYISTL
jgi:hypothetical protein